MPVVDLTTEKIIGCEKGSKEYFHEQGHIVYNKSERGITYNYYQQLCTYWSIVFIGIALFIDFFKYLSAITITLSFYYFLYEEVWADKYSKEKWKEQN